MQDVEHGEELLRKDALCIDIVDLRIFSSQMNWKGY